MIPALALKRRHGMRRIPHQENTAGWQALELDVVLSSKVTTMMTSDDSERVDDGIMVILMDLMK